MTAPVHSWTPIFLFLIINIWLVVFCSLVINQKQIVPKSLYLSCVSTLTISLMQFWRLLVPSVRNRLHRFRPTALEFTIQSIWLFILAIWTSNLKDSRLNAMSYVSIIISVILVGIIIKRTFFVPKYRLYYYDMFPRGQNNLPGYTTMERYISDELSKPYNIEFINNEGFLFSDISIPWQDTVLLNYIPYNCDDLGEKGRKLSYIMRLNWGLTDYFSNTKLSYPSQVQAPFKVLVHILTTFCREQPNFRAKPVLDDVKNEIDLFKTQEAYNSSFIDFIYSSNSAAQEFVKKWIITPEGTHNLYGLPINTTLLQ